MARRRMLSTDVIGTDSFLGMSLRARELYVHLNLAADDDGFVSNVATTTRMVGASRASLEELTDRGYLIRFDNDIYLLTHWHVNNQIRKARYVPTIYQDELSQVTVENKKYRLLTDRETIRKTANPEPDDSRNESKWRPVGVQNVPLCEIQMRKDKNSLEECRKDKTNSGEGKDAPSPCIPSMEDLCEYASQIGYRIFNAEKFLAYYGARDWKHADGTPVADWRKQVDLWKAREGDYRTASSPRQSPWKPADQNDYDFDELEKRLVAN